MLLQMSQNRKRTSFVYEFLAEGGHVHDLQPYFFVSTERTFLLNLHLKTSTEILVDKWDVGM